MDSKQNGNLWYESPGGNTAVDSKYQNSWWLAQPAETPATGNNPGDGDKKQPHTMDAKYGQWSQKDEACTAKATKHIRKCGYKRYGKGGWAKAQCAIATNWICLLLSVGGGITLICVGVIHVKPYVTSLGYSNGTCETVNSSYRSDIHKCGGRYSKRPYPCLNIQVTIKVVSNSSITTVTGQLHETELDLSRHARCTYRPGDCSGNDENFNKERVAEYNATWGILGYKYPCLYEANSQTPEIIRVRQANTTTVVHMLLWPSLGFVVGGIIVLVLACVLGKKGWTGHD